MTLLHVLKVLAPSLVCVVWAMLRVTGTSTVLTVTGLLVLAAAFILAECERSRRK